MAVITTDRCFTTCIRMRTLLGWTVVVLLVAAMTGATPPRDCTGTRENLDVLKNFELPERPIQGPICGQYSCCGTAENHLKSHSAHAVEKFLKDSITQVSSIFNNRSRRLEELFKEMMQTSKKELHNMFERTYGIIYLQNSEVFTDFFAELEKYYLHGNIKLSETMDHFFSILYQRMFKVINAQYDFDEDYLNCVAKDMATLKPFGDIPKKLGIMLKRSFAATRIFHKALGKGGVLAEKTMKLNLSDECGLEVTKMRYCHICGRVEGPGPCNSFCTDTVKNCLQYFVMLNEHWNNYIDALEKVADKLLGPFNIEVVVQPINVKISEAIMNFQESGNEVSQKVFVECGAPSLKGNRKRRSADPERSKEISYPKIKFRNNSSKKKQKKTNDYQNYSEMEKRIKEAKDKIKETKNFWRSLPYQYCNNITTASPTEDGHCWNGTSIATYTSTTPSPKSSLPMLLSEQQFTLKLLVTKLESAFQGNDEELEDDEEDDSIISSGSGSGSGPEEEEDDIEVELPTTTVRTTTTTTESNDVFKKIYEEDDSPKVMTASATELTKALAHYVLPIVMVWFGGAFSELL